MTLAEIHKLLVLLQGWYGSRRVPADEATVAAWHALLGRHDTDLVWTAARVWGEAKSGPPAPADIVAEVRSRAARRAHTRELTSAGCPSCDGTGWQWLPTRDTVTRCDRGCRPPVRHESHAQGFALTDEHRTAGMVGVRAVLDRLHAEGAG